MPWFNPHADASCTVNPRGQAHQLLAGGAVNTHPVEAASLLNWEASDQGWFRRVGPASSATDGPYFVPNED